MFCMNASFILGNACPYLDHGNTHTHNSIPISQNISKETF